MATINMTELDEKYKKLELAVSGEITQTTIGGIMVTMKEFVGYLCREAITNNDLVNKTNPNKIEEQANQLFNYQARLIGLENSCATSKNTTSHWRSIMDFKAISNQDSRGVILS